MVAATVWSHEARQLPDPNVSPLVYQVWQDVFYHARLISAFGQASGHETLFPRLLAQVVPGGTMAVQMPGMHAAPLRALQPEVARSGPLAAQRGRDAAALAHHGSSGT